MVVPLFWDGAAFSFQARTPHQTPDIAVEAPSGSELLPCKSIGLRLFVPTVTGFRLAFDAEEVVRAAKEKRPGWAIVSLATARRG